MTAAFMTNELRSEGDVELVEPEDPDEVEPAEEPVDVYFEDTGEVTRTADFDNSTLELGETAVDEFVLINDHEDTVQLEMEGCTDFERTYFVGETEDDAEELDGNNATIVEDGQLFVQTQIDIPEDAETGSEQLCTDIDAAPS